MNASFHRFALWAGATLLLAGCELTADADADATGTGTAADLPPGLTDAEAEVVCTKMNTAICESLDSCAPVAMQAVWESVDNCKSQAIAGCKIALTRPGITVSPSEADACAAAHEAEACDVPGDPVACDFKGALTPGQPCSINDQCNSGRCSTDNDGGCGACLAIAADGEACGVGIGCERGSACDETCKKGAPEGAACESTEDCQDWLACDDASSKCVDAGKVAGQPCWYFACSLSAGLVCDDGCRTMTELSEPGGTCGANADETTATMCDFGLCDDGTCIGRAHAGEACGAEAFCDYALACVSGVCEPVSQGEICGG